MRCQRAQRWMTAALDRELSPRRRGALERHLARCAPCAREMAATERLLGALAALPIESDVSAGLEQATLRRVRLEADAAGERHGVGEGVRNWWAGITLPALAGAAVLALVLSTTLRTPPGPAPGRETVGAPPSPAAQDAAAPKTPAPSRLLARRAAPPPPADERPDLASAPELFVDLPILRNMEKLQHFEAIRTTTLDDELEGPGEEQSNG